MKNINLSVDEATWDKAETFASVHHTSVTKLLLNYLHEITAAPSSRDAARARFLELSQAAQGEVGARRWTRDDLYAR